MTSQSLTYEPSGFTRRVASSPDEYRRTVGVSEMKREQSTLWDELIGPVLLTAQVANRMGWSADQVEVARKDLAILGCRTRDGVWVFPEFQFSQAGSGELVAGFAEVLQCFREADVELWAIASWFVTTLRSLDGRSPIDVLRSASTNSERELAVHAARVQTRAWQQ